MDYDYVVAEQNLSAYGVVDDQQSHLHRQAGGGGDDEYEEDNQRQDYYSERGGGVGDMGPPVNIDDNTTAAHRLKHSVDDDSYAGKLFVGGIAWETSEESFSRYFSKYGVLTDTVIMMDKISGRPRGFGFVTFADPEVANKVLDEEHVIDGRTVEVKRTVPREDMHSRRVVSRTKKIFVGGLPVSLSEDELREYFSVYGKVVEYQIMLDHITGRSRGFGFVTFETEDAVEGIFTDGQMHELGGKQVEVKKAEPKRSGFDHSSESRMRRSGSNSTSYGGYSGGADGFDGGYGGKLGRGFGGYGGYGSYGGYGNYAGNYGGGAGFYAGYGGYGYGFGFGGPMYGGAGFGASGYGTPGGYGGASGYGSGRGYGGGYDGNKSYGGGGSAAGYGGPEGFGGGAGSGGGGNKGYGSSGAANGRFHPYWK